MNNDSSVNTSYKGTTNNLDQYCKVKNMTTP